MATITEEALEQAVATVRARYPLLFDDFDADDTLYVMNGYPGDEAVSARTLREAFDLLN